MSHTPKPAIQRLPVTHSVGAHPEVTRAVKCARHSEPPPGIHKSWRTAATVAARPTSVPAGPRQSCGSFARGSSRRSTPPSLPAGPPPDDEGLGPGTWCGLSGRPPPQAPSGCGIRGRRRGLTFGPGMVPTWSPSWHQAGTKLAPSWHQAGTKLAPSWHQAWCRARPLGTGRPRRPDCHRRRGRFPARRRRCWRTRTPTSGARSATPPSSTVRDLVGPGAVCGGYGA